jgi:hypothetical protein
VASKSGAAFDMFMAIVCVLPSNRSTVEGCIKSTSLVPSAICTLTADTCVVELKSVVSKSDDTWSKSAVSFLSTSTYMPEPIAVVVCQSL